MERLVQASKDPLNTYPIYIEISPVGHCNHRCTFCAVDYIGYKPRSLDLATFKQRIAEMGALGVKSVMFAGEGEPLLHKQIDQIVEATASTGIDVAFTTNGVLLDKIMPVLKHIKWVKVSLNAGERVAYAKIHQTKESDWDKVWDNLSAARKLRSKETALGVQCVAIPDNLGTIKALVQKACETGLDYIVIKPYSQHRSSDTRRYAEIRYDEDVLELFKELETLSTDSFKVIARTNAISSWNSGAPKYNKCYATPTLWAYVMATGDLYTCSAYLLNDEFKMGNLNEQSFQEIWLGAKRQAHIEAMKHLDISKCRINCRMNQVNQFLATIEQSNPHANFL